MISFYNVCYLLCRPFYQRPQFILWHVWCRSVLLEKNLLECKKKRSECNIQWWKISVPQNEKEQKTQHFVKASKQSWESISGIIYAILLNWNHSIIKVECIRLTEHQIVPRHFQKVLAQLFITQLMLRINVNSSLSKRLFQCILNMKTVSNWCRL